MQKARPKAHAPAPETANGGTTDGGTKTVEGGVGEAQPHKSADLQVRKRLERPLDCSFALVAGDGVVHGRPLGSGVRVIVGVTVRGRLKGSCGNLSCCNFVFFGELAAFAWWPAPPLSVCRSG